MRQFRPFDQRARIRSARQAALCTSTSSSALLVLSLRALARASARNECAFAHNYESYLLIMCHTCALRGYVRADTECRCARREHIPQVRGAARGWQPPRCACSYIPCSSLGGLAGSTVRSQRAPLVRYTPPNCTCLTSCTASASTFLTFVSFQVLRWLRLREEEGLKLL